MCTWKRWRGALQRQYLVLDEGVHSLQHPLAGELIGQVGLNLNNTKHRLLKHVQGEGACKLLCSTVFLYDDAQRAPPGEALACCLIFAPLKETSNGGQPTTAAFVAELSRSVLHLSFWLLGGSKDEKRGREGGSRRRAGAW